METKLETYAPDYAMSMSARIRENTRRVLFPDRDPRSFDIAAYAYSFDFCDTLEKERVYHAMKAAWAWGMGIGRTARGKHSEKINGLCSSEG